MLSTVWRLALLMLLLSTSLAHAKRVALVVGISDYAYSPRLENPGRDAAAMASALTAAGFEVVRSVNDDLPSLTRALDQFYTRADGAEAALFFYAGHGLQFEGVNYLVPRDAELRSETRLKQEAIALQDIIAAIEKRAAVTLVFLDACRDNPLAEQLQRSMKGKERSAGVTRGLAPMTIRNPDTLLVFAAAPGRTANDGEGQNSPFTTAILENIRQPDVEIELLMKRVTRDVVQATKGNQVPERLSRLTTEFVFNASPAQTIPPKQARLPAAQSQIPADAVPASPTKDWKVTKVIKTPAGLCGVLSNLNGPFQVRKGDRICDESALNHAIVKNVKQDAVIYSVNGGYEISCNTKELCQFDWPGAPMFNVRIQPGSTGTAELVAPKR
ncbi:MAG: caspase family protein [Hyphomicrobiaceae bacterium]